MSKSTKRAPTVETSSTPWRDYNVKLTNPQHQELFKRIASRPVKPTKFYDQSTCQSLLIDDYVGRLCRSLGREPDFFNITPPKTYPRLVLEFMSTLEQIFTEDDEGLNTSHPYVKLSRANLKKFWYLITGKKNFKPSHYKASDIVHLALRYVHSMIVSGAHPKVELGNVGTFDITALLVVATNMGNDQLPINFSGHFIDRVVDIRSKGGSGEIHFGGMVTLIARYVSIPKKTFDTLALPPRSIEGAELLGSFIVSVLVPHTSMVAQTFFW
ncbi:D-aminoacyl-tRNA deacylase [Bienertia sinuspersici]